MKLALIVLLLVAAGCNPFAEDINLAATSREGGSGDEPGWGARAQ